MLNQWNNWNAWPVQEAKPVVETPKVEQEEPKETFTEKYYEKFPPKDERPMGSWDNIPTVNPNRLVVEKIVVENPCIHCGDESVGVMDYLLADMSMRIPLPKELICEKCIRIKELEFKKKSGHKMAVLVHSNSEQAVHDIVEVFFTPKPNEEKDNQEATSPVVQPEDEPKDPVDKKPVVSTATKLEIPRPERKNNNEDTKGDGTQKKKEPKKKATIKPQPVDKKKSDPDTNVGIKDEIEALKRIASNKEKSVFVVPEIKPVEKIPEYTLEPIYEIPERTNNIDQRDLINNATCYQLAKTSPDKEKLMLYSGKGKLHDIEFKECEDFHSYTVAKQEQEMGQFYTPDETIKESLEMLQIPKESIVFDICCGAGRWFNYLKDMTCRGCEIDWTSVHVARKLYEHAHIEYGCMSVYRPPQVGQAVVGNPPFNLKVDVPSVLELELKREGRGWMLSQDLYLEIANKNLQPLSPLYFIAPKTYLNDELFHKKVNEYIDKHFYRIAQIEYPDDLFKEYQIKFPTKGIFLVKKDDGLEYPHKEFHGTMNEFKQTAQYRWYLGINVQKQKLKAQYKYKDIKRKQENELDKIIAKAKQLCVVASRKWKEPRHEERLAKYTKELMTRIESEVKMLRSGKPFWMKKAKWDKQKPRPEETLKVYSRRLKEKWHKENWIRISKDDHNIIIKPSNPRVTEFLNRIDVTKRAFPIWKMLVRRDGIKGKAIHSIDDRCWEAHNQFWESLKAIKESDLLTIPRKEGGDRYTIELKIDLDVESFIKKRDKKYALNSHPANEMKDYDEKRYQELYAHLEQIRYDDKDGKEISLLTHQKEDLVPAIMKNYSYFSWDTGLGKTIGGITWLLNKPGKTIIVCPSVNVTDPWEKELKLRAPELDFIVIKKSKDIPFIKNSKVVIISLELLRINDKMLRKILKKEKGFRNIILDEADNIKSKNSKVGQSVMAVARRFENKLLMSGTPTRNNAVELYRQAELLWNNSENMLCTVSEISEYDRRSKEYEDIPNPLYMKPFPARAGFSNFQKCFSPKKVTVFGAEKSNQDLYNKHDLDKFFSSARLTRVFDIEKPKIDKHLGNNIGELQYELKQINVPMIKEEKVVYEYIFKELVQILQEKFQEKGHDAKTAKMIVIMQQIKSLLKGVSHPWTFAAWEGEDKLSSKMEKASEIFTEAIAQGKKIMFGSPWVPTVEKYMEHFSKNFDIYPIKSEYAKSKRTKIIDDFRNSDKPGILMGSIGCLKSGLNIPEVSLVVTDSYPWNMAQLKQFYARAVRLNTKHKVDIYCMSNEGSFDMNVFVLMLAKERINTFIRESKEIDVASLAEDFSVGTDMFSACLQMVKEKVDGRIVAEIQWGQTVLE